MSTKQRIRASVHIQLIVNQYAVNLRVKRRRWDGCHGDRNGCWLDGSRCQ